jgi:hypothetical protein
MLVVLTVRTSELGQCRAHPPVHEALHKGFIHNLRHSPRRAGGRSFAQQTALRSRRREETLLPHVVVSRLALPRSGALSSTREERKRASAFNSQEAAALSIEHLCRLFY